MTFAQKLQELRKGAGLSQEELAERLGVSRQSVSKWELGQAYPETEKIIEISRMFDVSLDVLLKGEEPPASQSPERPAPSRSRSLWLTVLGILAVLFVSVTALIFLFSYSSGGHHTGSLEEPASESTFPEEITPPEENVPASSAAPYDQPSDSPVSMDYLRGYYFDFARQYRLDYIPYFDEHCAPFDSTEYLFWAFAVNLDNWGEDKGIMTESYVDGMVERHFGMQRGLLSHQAMFKCWSYENGVYTAVPQSIREQPLYYLTEYSTYTEMGIRYHEITLEYYASSFLPTAEEDAALRLQVIAGNTADLSLLQRETFLYHMSATEPGVPVFDSHSIEYIN